jgi:hypothetical protein
VGTCAGRVGRGLFFFAAHDEFPHLTASQAMGCSHAFLPRCSSAKGNCSIAQSRPAASASASVSTPKAFHQLQLQLQLPSPPTRDFPRRTLHAVSVGSQSQHQSAVNTDIALLQSSVRVPYLGAMRRGRSPVTRYSSSPSMVCMSPSSIEKPPTSEFSTILASCTLFGRGTKPCCKLQRTNSCPGVQPYLLARCTMVGCFIFNARTSGAYASTTISCAKQYEVMSLRVLKGCTSIWFTAGSTRGLESRSSCSWTRVVSSVKLIVRTVLSPHLRIPCRQPLFCSYLVAGAGLM